MKPNNPNNSNQTLFNPSPSFFEKPFYPKPASNFFEMERPNANAQTRHLPDSHAQKNYSDPSQNILINNISGFEKPTSMPFSIPPYSFTNKKSVFPQEPPNAISANSTLAHASAKIKKYEDKIEEMKAQIQEITGLLKNSQSNPEPGKAERTFNISNYDTMSYIRYPADGDIYRPNVQAMENPSQIQYVYNEVINPRPKANVATQEVFRGGFPGFGSSNVHRKHQTPSTNSYYFKPTDEKKLFWRGTGPSRCAQKKCSWSCEHFHLESMKKFEVISTSLLNIMNTQMEIKNHLNKNERIRQAEFSQLNRKLKGLESYFYENPNLVRSAEKYQKSEKMEVGNSEMESSLEQNDPRKMAQKMENNDFENKRKKESLEKPKNPKKNAQILLNQKNPVKEKSEEEKKLLSLKNKTFNDEKKPLEKAFLQENIVFEALKPTLKSSSTEFYKSKIKEARRENEEQEKGNCTKLGNLQMTKLSEKNESLFQFSGSIGSKSIFPFSNSLLPNSIFDKKKQNIFVNEKPGNLFPNLFKNAKINKNVDFLNGKNLNSKLNLSNPFNVSPKKINFLKESDNPKMSDSSKKRRSGSVSEFESYDYSEDCSRSKKSNIFSDIRQSKDDLKFN